MLTIRAGTAAIAAALWLGLAAGSVRAADPVDPGLPVGARAPVFSAPDQDGRERRLPDARQEGMLALVFHRSADW
ncbi:MAG: hypothetical protein H7A45_18050 [Verrucomicrobiales bacterium]|nr:hypothetical protein [Verrucomicrobiales bacterium]MCP5525465.1 hypothetical protein [Verrucomicrobiales bacterium]